MVPGMDNLWPWPWLEAFSKLLAIFDIISLTIFCDEESAPVLNSQHRETVMPFISDTKQQKGTPVDNTQELSQNDCEVRTDEVRKGPDYNPRPRRWSEASSISSDGESATVLNSQHRETVTPFISDTKQQKGTPVDNTQEVSFTSSFESSVLPSFQTVFFEAKAKALEAKAKAKSLEAKAKAKALEASVNAFKASVFDAWALYGKMWALEANAEALEAKAMALEAKAEAKVWEQFTIEIKARLERARLERMEELKVFIFRLMRTKKAMAFLLFSLKELVSLLKSIRSGWGPPLEMAARMLNSKFWVMEADVWADLLIVCCWANPTIYCKECGKDVELATTSCKHVVCPGCTVRQGIGLRCPECGQALTVSFSRKRRLGEPTTTATKRPCTDSGTSMVTRSRSKAAKQTKPVSAIPLTTPDPAPPASKGSCSHESQSESLTTDNLDKLLNNLHPARNKWYYLGLCLGLFHHDLDAIRTEQKNCLDRLREMLVTRLDMKKLSKKELILSLKKPTVGFSELAQMLKDPKHW